MKKMMMALMFLLATTITVDASIYYVRPDGGNATQCSGLVDAPYSGTNNCALNHPYWVHAPQGNNPTKLQGGDTLIIDGEYMMGYGAPNTGDTSKCYSAWPYDCYMRAIPSGTILQPTRILGKNWQNCTSKAALWGTEMSSMVLNLSGSSNVEVQCLDITDKEDCIEHQGDNLGCIRNVYPNGQWARNGLYASDSTNVLIKNVDLHGFAGHGVHAGRLKDWILDTVRIYGNGWAGWDGDIGANASSNSGYMKFINSKIVFNGCAEKYPTTNSLTSADFQNCWSQSQGGYGDGLGTHATGGDWYFENSEISHNTSDGLDLLYHNGNGKIEIKSSIFNGNAGNQIKLATSSVLDGVYTDGLCAYFNNQPFTYRNGSGFDNCRAMGDTIALTYNRGRVNSIKNSTIKGQGNVLIITSGSTCDGTEKLFIEKTSLEPGTEFHSGEPTAVYYACGSDGNGSGACGTLQPTYVTVETCGNEECSSIETCNSCPQDCGSCPCVPDGSCSAPNPACGQTTIGVDNCGNQCTKVGSICPPQVVTVTMTQFKNKTKYYIGLVDSGTRVIITYYNKQYEIIKSQ